MKESGKKKKRNSQKSPLLFFLFLKPKRKTNETKQNQELDSSSETKTVERSRDKKKRGYPGLHAWTQSETERRGGIFTTYRLSARKAKGEGAKGGRDDGIHGGEGMHAKRRRGPSSRVCVDCGALRQLVLALLVRT